MTVFILTIAYVLIVVFLLLISLRSPYRWQYKAGIILVCSLFYGVIWHTLPKLQGWPIDDPVPDEFRLISKHIVQPNKLKDSEGAIYMWVIDLAEDADPMPRAYQLPYKEELHKDLIIATKRGGLQRGIRVAQSTSDAEGEPSSNIRFESMPKTRPPRKK
jgi:hypothetical protein